MSQYSAFERDDAFVPDYLRDDPLDKDLIWRTDKRGVLRLYTRCGFQLGFVKKHGPNYYGSSNEKRAHIVSGLLREAMAYARPYHKLPQHYFEKKDNSWPEKNTQ